MVLQVVDDVVQVVSSLIQWQPENIMVDSSSRYYRIMLGYRCMVVIVVYLVHHCVYVTVLIIVVWLNPSKQSYPTMPSNSL